MVEKSRVSITLPKPYLDFMAKQVRKGLYLSQGGVVMDALRLLAEKFGTPLGAKLCPQCDSPATHPSGLCRDCHQAKLEAGPQ